MIIIHYLYQFYYKLNKIILYISALCSYNVFVLLFYIEEIAQWELKALATSEYIICGFDTDSKNIGLTTRTEFGMKLGSRKNLICYRPDDSYYTDYLVSRAKEYNIHVLNNLPDVVERLVVLMTNNNPTFEYDPRHKGYTIHPNGCDIVVLEAMIKQIELIAQKGSYVFLKPYDRKYNEMSLLERYGYEIYGFHKLTNTLVFCKWHSTDECKIPQFATFISGTGMIVTRNNKTEILMAYEKEQPHFGFRPPSESGNLGENHVNILVRGMKEEFGYDIDIATTTFTLVGGYSLANARQGNIGDVCFYVACDLPAGTEFEIPSDGEITKYVWINIDDYLNEKVTMLDDFGNFYSIVGGQSVTENRVTTVSNCKVNIINHSDHHTFTVCNSCNAIIANGKITVTISDGQSNFRTFVATKVDTFMMDAVRTYVENRGMKFSVNGNFSKF